MEGFLRKKIVWIYVIALVCVSSISAYAQPTNHPTGFTVTATSATDITLTWTGTTGGTLADGYLIVARKAGGTFAAVADGTPVADDLDWTGASANASMTVTHAVGLNTLSFSSLDPETLYEFELYAFTGAGATINYKMSATVPTGSDRTFSLEPAAYPAAFTATAANASQIDLAFSAASTLTNADGYILLRRTGAAPDISGVLDGNDPGSLVLTGGTTLVTTITSAATVTFPNTGLTPSTAYQYVLIPYSYNGSNNSTYNYKTDGTVPNASASTPGATVTIAQISGGGSNIAVSPLASASNNQAILGFSVASDAATTFSAVNIQIVNPGTGLTNVRLFRSLDASFGGDTDLGGTVNLTGTQITISGLSQAIVSTPANYFLVADVKGTVNSSTPTITPLFTQANITVGPGTTTAVSVTGITYSFADASPPIPSFNPANSATGISINSNIVITFDEPIRTTPLGTPLTLVDLLALIELKENNDSGTPVAFTASIDVTQTIITINPTPTLLAGQFYYVEIGPVEDAFDNASSSSSITFQTEFPPAITTFSPSPMCIGEAVVITGQRFGTGTPTVRVNGVIATLSSIPAEVTNTSIKFFVPNTTSGTIEVTNGTNGLSVTSGTPLVINPVINVGLPITVSPPSPSVGQNFSILVGGTTQASVSYNVERPSGTFAGSQTGNGGQLTFGTFSHAGPGTYLYKVHLTSTNCAVPMPINVNVTILNVTAEAGPATITICQGEVAVLGGVAPTPTASGGTGFLSISWAGPGAFSSTLANPEVTVAGIYNLTVKDNTGATATDMVEVIVNNKTPRSQLDIILNPSKPNRTYQVTDPRVELTFELNGSPGIYAGETKFQGPGVNSTGFQKFFYPNAADLGSNEIELVYQNADGCITTDSLIVFVRDNGTFMTGLSPQYCEGTPDNVIVVTPVEYLPFKFDFGIFGTFYFPGTRYTYQNVVHLRDVNSGVLIDGSISAAGTNITMNTSTMGPGPKQFELYYLIQNLSYNDADPANPNVTSSYFENIIVSFNVIPKPVLFSRIPAEVCENADPFTLVVEPTGGSFKLNGNNTTPSFDPGTSGLPNSNTINYTYTDANSCTNSENFTININRLPGFNFTAANACVNEVISIVPSFTNPSSIPFYYEWDSDGNGQYDTLVDQTTPRTLYRTYVLPSTYQLKLRITTNKGCQDEIAHPLVIGQVPDLKLSWSNVCDGDAVRFGFVSNYYKNNLPDMDSVNWYFGDGVRKKVKNPVQVDSVTTYLYGAADYFTATVTLRTDLNCTQTASVNVYKVIKTGAVGAQEYYEDFNDATFASQAWKTGGTNNSWAWGTPAGALINSDAEPGGGKAWVTNLAGVYNINEDSWVHSPCFNLSQIERPVLSFDYRSLTFDRVDGGVLQYTTKNSTNKESDWIVLGAIGSGKNWYNRDGIASNPGNQPLLQLGWTGKTDSTAWRSAIIPLDNALSAMTALERTKVRFRFAFASSEFTPDGEGFAFDNFKISQRDRVVLIEQFTNNGGENVGSDPNKVANTAINTFLNNSSGEVVKLEYHIGISGPNEDPIYKTNPVDANARAGYYGVTSTPTALIDSRTGNAATVFAEQTLSSAEVMIDTIFTPAAPADLFNVTVKFTAKNNLPANTVLHIAVIEKEITAAAAMGTNGETAFKYVMRKMLPDATGTRYVEPILQGEEREATYSWNPRVFDLEELAVIAFVQNEDTKEIYQTRILDDSDDIIVPPAIVTGNEPTWGDMISIYPNPANQSLVIKLPETAVQPVPMQISDALGRPVSSVTFGRGEREKTLSMSDLVPGTYVIQLKSASGETVRKKVMVIH